MPDNNNNKPDTLSAKADFIRAEYLMVGVIDEIEKEIAHVQAKNPNNNFILKKDAQVAKIVRYSVAAEAYIKLLEHVAKLQQVQITMLQDILLQKAQTDKTFNEYFMGTFSHLKKQTA
jgi:hypothetical protein